MCLRPYLGLSLLIDLSNHILALINIGCLCDCLRNVDTILDVLSGALLLRDVPDHWVANLLCLGFADVVSDSLHLSLSFHLAEVVSDGLHLGLSHQLADVILNSFHFGLSLKLADIVLHSLGQSLYLGLAD